MTKPFFSRPNGKSMNVKNVPRWARPKPNSDHITRICLSLMTTIQALTDGPGDESNLFDYLESMMTVKRVAELEKFDEAIAVINKCYTFSVEGVLARWIETGEVKFTPDEAVLAGLGLDYTRALCEATDLLTLDAAARWSEQKSQPAIQLVRNLRLEKINLSLAMIEAEQESRGHMAMSA